MVECSVAPLPVGGYSETVITHSYHVLCRERHVRHRGAFLLIFGFCVFSEHPDVNGEGQKEPRHASADDSSRVDDQQRIPFISYDRPRGHNNGAIHLPNKFSRAVCTRSVFRFNLGQVSHQENGFKYIDGGLSTCPTDGVIGHE
jgi:hypothetical protein